LGLPLETGEAKPRPARFAAAFSPEMVRSFDQVRAHLAIKNASVVDARSAPRFRGEAPEPRAGVAAGHMPGATNVPYDTIADDLGRLKPAGEIRKLFQDAGVDLSAPVVTTCGSGVTAAALLLALASIGKHDVTLYDGSWTEWGSRPGAPVATGPP
jgi:thiosulfate/3-mercaptopyruvate sulfurtransferase